MSTRKRILFFSPRLVLQFQKNFVTVACFRFFRSRLIYICVVSIYFSVQACPCIILFESGSIPTVVNSIHFMVTLLSKYTQSLSVPKGCWTVTRRASVLFLFYRCHIYLFVFRNECLLLDTLKLLKRLRQIRISRKVIVSVPAFL